MAVNKMKDFSGKDASSLVAQISDFKRELLNLRFQKASGELTNTARFREVRSGIARAYTELNKSRKSK